MTADKVSKNKMKDLAYKKDYIFWEDRYLMNFYWSETSIMRNLEDILKFEMHMVGVHLKKSTNLKEYS